MQRMRDEGSRNQRRAVAFRDFIGGHHECLASAMPTEKGNGKGLAFRIINSNILMKEKHAKG